MRAAEPWNDQEARGPSLNLHTNVLNVHSPTSVRQRAVPCPFLWFPYWGSVTSPQPMLTGDSPGISRVLPRGGLALTTKVCDRGL